MAFTFGCPYGTATLKYFQDHRNAALEKGHTPFSKGGHFPTLFSANPNIMLSNRSRTRDRWLHTPTYTRFNLDNDRSTQLTCFYQVGRPPPDREEGWWLGPGETSHPPGRLYLLF